VNGASLAREGKLEVGDGRSAAGSIEQLVDQWAAAAADAAGPALPSDRVVRAGARLDGAAHIAISESLAVADEHERILGSTKMKINVVFENTPRGITPAI